MVDTDSILGATVGLLAVGVMANTASKMIKPIKVKKQKHSYNIKHSKTKWL
jgi:hypothetical protein